jgi:hypothetical protein
MSEIDPGGRAPWHRHPNGTAGRQQFTMLEEADHPSVENNRHAPRRTQDSSGRR